VSVWNSLRAEFTTSLNIETNTPVESISVSVDGPAGFPYALKTNRGTIFVRHVVHATNGFASHLVPGLRRRIVGARAHMCAQQPGESFPIASGMRSWSVVNGEAFDYVCQRPSPPNGPPGDLLVGGGFMRSSKQGVDQVGLYDDGAVLDALTISHIVGILPATFYPNWGIGAEVKQLWSGILGLTGDSLPFVGRLPVTITGRDVQNTESSNDTNRQGEWIAAGFCGEGMVWAWLCGAALGIMVAGSEEENLTQIPGRPGGRLAEWFPIELQVSSKRIRSANISNLANSN
jgi:glycine/D-amino acid oxidase-like deaminating enzyme